MKEKIITPMNGFFVLIATWILIGASIYAAISSGGKVVIIVPSIVIIVISFILMGGLKIINPNEAGVYVLFGKYYGTITKPGYYYINPFCTLVNPTVGVMRVPTAADGKTQSQTIVGKKISLKAMTLDNNKQKINDKEGNPIDIGVIVIWRVINATKAVFEVDNYYTYVAVQCDAALRNVARKYPYDVTDDDEKSLRGSASEVADELKKELQSRVDLAGLEIIETRIAHLAYAQEIAAIMLQRQQAAAIIAARQRIVEGAVGMVEMALNKLSENEVVSLDDERKAAMVSNLLVVLCGGKDAQPVINSGSIY